MNLTPLQNKAVKDIVYFVRQNQLQPGQHLTELELSKVLHISRTPIKFALQYLASKGMFIHDKNRGFFLAESDNYYADLANEIDKSVDDPLYIEIARRRLRKELPDKFTETDFIRLFNTSRSTLKNVLIRIQQEGWIEQCAGQGWCFLPLIDSVQAYEESYAYRAITEPAGILMPTFMIDYEVLELCKQKQLFIIDGNYLTMTPSELFENNAQFHEMLAEFSGNRFHYQNIKRINQLRRLVEYHQVVDRHPRKAQAEEHLQIIQYLEKGDRLKAADILRQHLEQARRVKINEKNFNNK